MQRLDEDTDNADSFSHSKEDKKNPEHGDGGSHLEQHSTSSHSNESSDKTLLSVPHETAPGEDTAENSSRSKQESEMIVARAHSQSVPALCGEDEVDAKDTKAATSQIFDPKLGKQNSERCQSEPENDSVEIPLPQSATAASKKLPLKATDSHATERSVITRNIQNAPETVLESLAKSPKENTAAAVPRASPATLRERSENRDKRLLNTPPSALEQLPAKREAPHRSTDSTRQHKRPKQQKQHRRPFILKKKRLKVPPFQAIDDRSDIAYRCALAKLRLNDYSGAVRFYQGALENLYADAKKTFAICNTDTNNDDELIIKQKKRLFGLRSSLVGMWCCCVRTLMEVADLLVAASKRKDNRKQHRDELATKQAQGHQKRDAILQFSLAMLLNATKCRLVGNHAWIAMTYSRVVQNCINRNILFLTDGRNQEDSSIVNLVTVDNAIRACSKCMENPLPMLAADANDAVLDQNVIPTLHEAKLIDSPTQERSILSVSSFSNESGNFIFQDGQSLSLISKEKSDLQSFAECKAPQQSTGSGDPYPMAQALSDLPMPHDRDTEIVGWSTVSSAKANDPANDPVIVDIQSDGIGEADDNSVELKIPDMNDIGFFPRNKDDKEQSLFDVFRRQGDDFFSLSSQVKEAATNRNNRTKILSVDYICTKCKNSCFSSLERLQEHWQECGNAMFGDSKLKAEWRLSSFDPEEGRGRPLEELMQLLDHAVELFEAQENEIDQVVPECEESYCYERPYFAGQVGLRCQHCSNADFMNQSARVFPPSIQSLPFCMWTLCLDHIDKCDQRPRYVREIHQEFRERISLDSSLHAEYWETVASQLGLAEIDSRLGLKWVQMRRRRGRQKMRQDNV